MDEDNGRFIIDELVDNLDSFNLYKFGLNVLYIGLSRPLTEEEKEDMRHMLFEKGMAKKISTPNAVKAALYLFYPRKLHYAELKNMIIDSALPEQRLYNYLRWQTREKMIFSEPEWYPIPHRIYWIEGSNYRYVETKVIYPLYRLVKAIDEGGEEMYEKLKEYVKSGLVISHTRFGRAKVDLLSGRVEMVLENLKPFHLFDYERFKKVDAPIKSKEEAYFNPYNVKTESYEVRTKLLERINGFINAQDNMTSKCTIKI